MTGTHDPVNGAHSRGDVIQMISDKAQEARLRNKNAVVETDYYDNGSAKVRRSDHTRTDDVVSGVILAKKYFLNGDLAHQETEFNPGMLYSFVFPVLSSGEVQCPNCGGTGENALFADGCPYCGAFYNMQYQTEELARRNHSDYVLAERKSLLLPLILIMSVSILAGVLIFMTTGRTSTPFDFAKGVLIGAIAGGLIYLAYSIFRSRTSLTSEEVRKKREQDITLERFREGLTENGLTMGEFVNSLNLGLRDHYFGSEADDTQNIIDFDVLDYRDQQIFRQEGKVYAQVDAAIRLVSADDGKVNSNETVKRIRMRKSDRTGPALKAGMNIVSCPFCGAAIDLATGSCSYCKTPFRHDRPLNIEKVTKVR